MQKILPDPFLPKFIILQRYSFQELSRSLSRRVIFFWLKPTHVPRTGYHEVR